MQHYTRQGGYNHLRPSLWSSPWRPTGGPMAFSTAQGGRKASPSHGAAGHCSVAAGRYWSATQR
eukprot:7162494-Pyramimonas_sp.AAC.1